MNERHGGGDEDAQNGEMRSANKTVTKNTPTLNILS